MLVFWTCTRSTWVLRATLAPILPGQGKVWLAGQPSQSLLLPRPPLPGVWRRTGHSQGRTRALMNSMSSLTQWPQGRPGTPPVMKARQGWWEAPERTSEEGRDSSLGRSWDTRRGSPVRWPMSSSPPVSWAARPEPGLHAVKRGPDSVPFRMVTS